MLVTADNDLDDNNLESSSEDDLPSIGEDENKHWGSLKSLYLHAKLQLKAIRR